MDALERQGAIIGKPTLLALYGGKLEAQPILDRLRGVGYPLDDVSIYYRPQDTDQVIDAVTGQIAAGQSLTDKELAALNAVGMQTLVLIHPEQSQAAAIQSALNSLGAAQIMFSGETVAIGRPGGVERRDSTS